MSSNETNGPERGNAIAANSTRGDFHGGPDHRRLFLEATLTPAGTNREVD